VQVPLAQLVAAGNLVIDLVLEVVDLLFFVCKSGLFLRDFLQGPEFKFASIGVLPFGYDLHSRLLDRHFVLIVFYQLRKSLLFLLQLVLNTLLLDVGRVIVEVFPESLDTPEPFHVDCMLVAYSLGLVNELLYGCLALVVLLESIKCCVLGLLAGSTNF